MSDYKSKLIDLKPWETVDFPWGVGVRKRNNDWTHIFIKPNGQEINLEQDGLKVILHDNGIEFNLKEEKG